MSILPDTIKSLTLHPMIAGIKEASGDPALAADMIRLTEGRLPVYCGNDDLIVPLMALGAKGAVSVCSNVVPAQTKAITHACLSGCFDEARDAQQALLPLIQALFAQVSPIPVKAALSMMGLIHDELRLPLTSLDEPYRSRLENLLRQMQLLQL